MASPYFFAVICIFSRGFLNIIDRLYFKNGRHSLSEGLLFNGIYAFLLIFVFAIIFSCSFSRMLSLMVLPEVFLSALSAQLVASVFSEAFKKMSVKAVVISAKLADLVIPVILIGCSQTFAVSQYVLAGISTCAFLPIIYSIRSGKEGLYLRYVLQIIVFLVFQAFINSYFEMHKFSRDLIFFIEVLTVILFWRMVFSYVSFLMIRFGKQRNKIDAYEKIHPLLEKNLSEVRVGSLETTNHAILAFRSILALIAQASFFYSIMQPSINVWPILNASPLIATFLASKILKERLGHWELISLITFFFILVLFLII